jgi:hypothetical protein
MIEKPMDVLKNHPIRRSDEQKSAFIADITEYARKLDYEVNVESGEKKERNIVIGNPNNAKYLVTAHYDTPATSLFPNLLLPQNFGLFFLYQMGVILGYMLIALLCALPIMLLTKNETASLLTWYVVYMALAMMGRWGPANKNNYNDNTSGVVTVLETLSALPQPQRELVCFVLFDQEEKGLVGSKEYRKRHKDQTDTQIILNLDCVGDGDTLQFEPVKSAQTEEILEKISQVCTKVGNKELRLATGSFTGSSDQKSFPKGIGIKALRYKKGVGYYCGKIHTNRDMCLDETNINILRDALITVIGTADK